MLPEKFKNRMALLLKDEYEDFIRTLETENEVKGLRINTLKLPVYDSASFSRFDITRLSYAKDGYLIKNALGVGHTPEHHAGIFYMQDPGAMASLSALDIKPGWRVLDTCAAPGGKSGQAAALIGEDGFLFSNEFVPKRAKILVSNFERLGIKNAVVSSLDTSELSKMYDRFFDLVIVDAPCSGEGMFRKTDAAISEWSEENVALCQKRQLQILENSYNTVRGGGYLLYSTCTYSLEENEMVVDGFLSRHSDFSLCEVKEELRRVSADGIQFEGAFCKDLAKSRRFYPHVSEGEGQFVALLRRDEVGDGGALYKDAMKEASREETAAALDFFKKNLTKAPDGKIKKYGENLVLISHGVPLSNKSIFSSGVLLGEVRQKILFPSHQFFSAYGELFIRQLELSFDRERLYAYLSGMQIDAPGLENGFCVVTYMGAVLGGGKISSGRLNNHYPKGLREKLN